MSTKEDRNAPCPLLVSQAQELHWDRIIESDAELEAFVVALRKHFGIAKSERCALKVEVQVGNKEDF